MNNEFELIGLCFEGHIPSLPCINMVWEIASCSSLLSVNWPYYADYSY